MLFLDSGPNVTPITDLINTWIHRGQAIDGSVAAPALILRCCVCHKHCCRAYLGAGELLRRG